LTAPKPEKDGRFTAMARPTAATYLTEQATPHLAATTAAATPKLTSVYKQQLRLHLTATATPHRTVITDFLLRVPATLVIGVTDGVADERVVVPARGNPHRNMPRGEPPTSSPASQRGSLLVD